FAPVAVGGSSGRLQPDRLTEIGDSAVVGLKVAVVPAALLMVRSGVRVPVRPGVGKEALDLGDGDAITHQLLRAVLAASHSDEFAVLVQHRAAVVAVVDRGLHNYYQRVRAIGALAQVGAKDLADRAGRVDPQRLHVVR